jgi:protein SCO1/2
MANDKPASPSQKRWATISPREQIRKRYFPDVTLTTHEGKRVRFYDDLIKDRIVVMNFMYAKCQGICSPVTANLTRVQSILKDRVGRDIFMYSFSLKPDEDTPEALDDYVKERKIGPGWKFVTGKPADLELIRRRLGFTDPDPSRDADKTNHTGMVRFGNEPMQLWAAFAGMSKAESIVNEILWVASPPRDTRPEAAKKG